MGALAGKKQSSEHIRKRIIARLKNNPRYMPEGTVAWNKGKTKESDERIAKYAEKTIKGRKRAGTRGQYISCYVPEHPSAVRGYVMEHRLAMERSIGRYLYKHEEVHHKNENKTDNRIDNLELMTKSEHSRHHLSFGELSRQERLDNWDKRRKHFGPSGGNSQELYEKMWKTRRERYGESGIKLT